MGYNVVPHIHDLDGQRAMPSSVEYPRWRAIAGSGNNLALSTNIVVPNPKHAGLCVKLYTYGLD